MTVYLVDPSVISVDRSHNAGTQIGHTLPLVQAGLDVCWAVNCKCEVSYDGVDCEKLFRYTVYDDARNRYSGIRRLLAPFYYMWLQNGAERALKELIRDRGIGPGDHIVLTMTDWITFSGLARVLSDLGPGNAPSVHYILMYELAGWMTGGYPYEEIKTMIMQQHAQDFDIHLYTETRQHQDKLAKETGMPVGRQPYPAQPVPEDCFKERDRQHESSGVVEICCPGGGRRDKGYPRLPSIIAKFNKTAGDADLPEVRFNIQLPRRQDALEDVVEKLKQTRNVRLIPNQLEPEAYSRLLQSCHIALLPYNENVYSTRGSGIVFEALANQLIIVCPANTSLAEVLEQASGESATTDDEFVSAITKILGRFDAYRERARHCAGQYRQQYFDNRLLSTITAGRGPES